ncbi:MGDG synthase family glycosyltransferase [Limnochorda pilosa]|uniref:UDP-N-acetylglucosamine:LPS N-acetylglucosamine transferase n=1 Tax=Limnochorda pilosa TaxID=1555112 RepID=A0A0K2SN49_LIMPI|nr:glycosyltransferase [Limnochorda pilosa]BAS28540.1 UDP-N-acetylglucosamine:LPS N-acetylglucosamine transferase [Limnochorda pilosa]
MRLRVLEGSRFTARSADAVLLESTYGGGHIQAGAALAAALAELDPSLTVERIDFFDLVNPVVNGAARFAYIQSVTRAPVLWREFYERTGQLTPESSWQQFLYRLGARRLARFLAQRRPRVVVATHPTPGGVAAQLRRGRQLDAPVATVITDYIVHSQWLHPDVDLYIAGAEAVREALVARGIRPDRVAVTGIPIHPRFRQRVDPFRVRQRLGLSHQPVVLFMAGGYGMVRGMVPACRQLAFAGGSFQLIVVSGRDALLERRIREVVEGSPRPVRVLGFVREVHELMSVADLLISKAGGLTVTEALAKGLPMVIYRPIPGQEEGNARFLVSRGAGRVVQSPEELVSEVQRLLDDPERRRRMAQAAAALGHPRADEEAARAILALARVPAAAGREPR